MDLWLDVDEVGIFQAFSRYFIELVSSLFRKLRCHEPVLGLLLRLSTMYHGIRVIIIHEFWFDVADLCLLPMIWFIAEFIMDYKSKLFRNLGLSNADVGLLLMFSQMYHEIGTIIIHTFWY